MVICRKSAFKYTAEKEWKEPTIELMKPDLNLECVIGNPHGLLYLQFIRFSCYSDTKWLLTQELNSINIRKGFLHPILSAE